MTGMASTITGTVTTGECYISVDVTDVCHKMCGACDIRGDRIEVFQIINNFDQINPEIFDMNNVTVTRGNGMELKVQIYNTIAHKSLQC